MEYLLCFAALFALGTAADTSYSYLNQAQWADVAAVCGNGSRQSPINIISAEVQEEANLLDLVLSNWGIERTGTFKNSGGHTVQFTPSERQDAATTENHQGTYEVKQFHLHWGATNGVGSEHIVDETPASAELHFVHQRTLTPSDEGRKFAVVGVLADVVENAALAGVWSQVDVLRVQKYDSEAIETTVTFSDLLPSNLSYYYYEGSLTTPPCSEVVQWFLLKERISIPEDFLKQLRQVETNSNGDLLTFNFREPQALNDRVVAMHSDQRNPDTIGAGLTVVPFISLVLLSIVSAILL